MLRGTTLVDATTNLTLVSNFLLGLVWPSDVSAFYNIVLTNGSEMFSASFDPDFFMPEKVFMKLLRNHQEMLEFSLKYSIEDSIAYNIMIRNHDYVKGHYQLPPLMAQRR